MNTHLSDTDIQHYALHPVPNAHLDNCPQCREKALQYQHLFSALNTGLVQHSTVSVADAVMARIASSQQRTQKVRRLENIAAGICTAMGAGLLIAAAWYTGCFAGIASISLVLLAVATLFLLAFLLTMQLRGYLKILQLSESALQPKQTLSV
ncbi:hypothetical protein SAMN05444266_103136 [Chitinophaga jiangningensis]|uniref:Uncharacterized protein n=1 Tax=Chitinophaga jiangningensis TaxID=1419482 RepID=A0A1M7A5R5_9BACT|nr:hypothetical protein [Chitinophaga jiangningensis]SHL37993.1 hypothetical protein SAMN05444266_103136 [Chitinophaga jiangningensis]